MALALALGLGEGEVAVAVDDTLSTFTVAANPTADATGRVDGLADASGLFLPRAGGRGGGGLIETVASLLGIDESELGGLALDAEPGADGLVLVPALDDRAGAVLSGLDSSTTRTQLARAAYEGVACYALECIDSLEDAGVTVDLSWLTLVGAGGGSLAQGQVLADLAGTAVVMPATPRLAAAGACVQAAAVLHGRPTEEVAGAWGLGEGDVIEPTAGIDGAEVRAAFAQERSRQERALLDMG
jgi:xylulokinase